MIDYKEKLKIEKDFISLLLQNKELVSDWLSSPLSTKYFDEAHHYILRAITSSFNDGVLLTRKTFISFVKKNIKAKLDIQAQEHIFNISNMLNVDINDYPDLKNKIFEASVDRSTLKCIEDYQKDTKISGGLIAAKRLALNLGDIVVDSSSENKIYYESVSDYAPVFYNKLVENRNKKGGDDTILCHIKEIDETLGTGFAPGSLILFCGDVGGYKSTMMLNVAINVWKLSHKNVLYVPLEMPREKMYQKFMSRETQIPFEQLQHPKFLSVDQLNKARDFEFQVKAIENEHHCSFYIMEAPEQIPVSTIRREIERNIDVFKPNLVVVDYIANLIPDETTHRRDRNDLEVGDMLKYLRTMGKPGAIHEEGLCVVSGAQLGREGLKRYRKSGSKGVFYSEDIHGSHQYSADSDAMYAQMKPQQANDNTRIEFIQIKSRYGKNIFSNGSNKTMLEVDPKISLIKSINTTFYTQNQEEIMNKVNDSDALNFDEHIKKDDNSNDFDDLISSCNNG